MGKVVKPPTDTELIDLALTTANPEGLPNIAWTVPSSTELPHIEFGYDVTPTDDVEREYIWCAHCQHRTHWRGIVMRVPEGTRFLVGKDCGAELYGVEFSQISKRFAEKRQRQRALIWLRNANALVIDASIELFDALHHEAFNEFDRFRQTLRKMPPQVFSSLHKAANKSSGELTITERVRDLAAELARADKDEETESELSRLTVTQRKKLRRAGEIRRSKPQQIYKYIDRAIGKLNGTELLLNEVSPRKSLLAEAQQVSAIKEEILQQISDNISTSHLSAKVQRLRNSLKSALQQIEIVQAPLRFLSDSNVELLQAWLKGNEGLAGQIQVERKGISWVERSTIAVITLQLLQPSLPPSLQKCRELLAAIS